MDPLLKKGEIVIYRSKKLSKIIVDDILLIKKNNHTFLSRLIYKNNYHLIVKQDCIKTPVRIYNDMLLGVAVSKKTSGLRVPLDNIYLSPYLIYLKEINHLNKLLLNHNISFLYLKGVPLYLHILNHPLRRFFFDCDILVNQKELEKFEDILRLNGYKKVNTDLSPRHAKLKDKVTEISYSKTIQGIPIVLDVHYEIVFMMNQIGKLEMFYPQNKIDELTGSFLRHRKFVTINSNRYPLLSDLHLVLYLSLHIFHHNYRGYNRYDFLDHVLNKIKVDWKNLENLISYFNFKNFLYFAFFYYQQFYRYKLPENFLTNLAPKNKIISKTIGNINIFEDEQRTKAGIHRFVYLLLLSPTPWYKKLSAFKNTSVLISILAVLKNTPNYLKKILVS